MRQSRSSPVHCLSSYLQPFFSSVHTTTSSANNMSQAVSLCTSLLMQSKISYSRLLPQDCYLKLRFMPRCTSYQCFAVFIHVLYYSYVLFFYLLHPLTIPYLLPWDPIISLFKVNEDAVQVFFPYISQLLDAVQILHLLYFYPV